MSRVSTIAQPLNVDVEGPGEILRITAQPTDGRRALQYDKDAVIRDKEGKEEGRSLGVGVLHAPDHRWVFVPDQLRSTHRGCSTA